MKYTVIALLAALFAVQAVELNDELVGLPFDLSANFPSVPEATKAVNGSSIQFLASTLVDVLKSLPVQSTYNGIIPYSVLQEYFAQKVSEMQNSIPPAELELIINSFKSINAALEILIPTFPALQKSLITLTKALPDASVILTKYANSSLLPREVYQEMKQLYPVLNEAVEDVIPAFPGLADSLAILTNELIHLGPALPSITRYMSTYKADSVAQYENSIPVLKNATIAYSKAFARFYQKVFPSLYSAVSTFKSGNLFQQQSLRISPQPQIVQHPFRFFYVP